MEDSEGSEVEFTVVGESFQLIENLTDVEKGPERNAIIRTYISNMEKEDLPTSCDFPKGLEWFNVTTPLSLEGNLHGKLVVLDFFTYCCINCMHILPALHRLEQRHTVADGLVVVGIHSAKFENEKQSANILSAVLRYDITHPVVNDANLAIWQQMDVHCWPTLVVLNPAGRVLLHLVGEGHTNLLAEFIHEALAFYADRGELNMKNDLPIHLSRESLPPSPLLFPGKIAINSNGERLAVADTGHHRILVIDTTGVVQALIGCGEPGLKDGSFKEARFNAPQGITWKENTVFVADTENHAIRKIDLDKGHVSTLAGNGTQGQDRVGGGQGIQQPISSPWDLALTSSPGNENFDVLVIAMAGTHQIWLLFLDDGKWLGGKSYTQSTCVRFAGTGAEENRNNSYPHAAAFAQPSGITLGGEDGKMLFIADSESSSIRSLSLTNGAVRALVGASRDPRNLFAFGDKDGKGVEAKLQHPLGVAMEPKDNGRLLVADSYNHKIKAVDISTRQCHTLFGCGKPGDTDSDDLSEVAVNEPGGLAVHPVNGKVYIADTNNHSIKVFDPVTNSVKKMVVLLPTEKSTKDEVDAAVDEVDSSPRREVYKPLAPKSAQVIQGDTVPLTPGSRLQLQLNIELSTGLHPTEGAPLTWQISIEGGERQASSILSEVPVRRGTTDDYALQPVFTLVIPPETAPGVIHVRVECISYYCDDAGACRMKGLVFKVPLEVTTSDSELDNRNNTHCLHHLISKP